MYINSMQTINNHSRANKVKIDQIEAALTAILTETLRRGFHGKARLELTIEDGTIQHFRRVISRVEK